MSLNLMIDSLGMSKKCSNLILKFYKSFVKGKCVLASNPGIAEFAKLSENSFRDLNIAKQ